MTTIAPPPMPAETPRFDTGEPTRLVRVCANLMPEEIITARAVRKVQVRLVIALVMLVALIGVSYGYAKWQTGSAEDDLAGAQRAAVSLQSQAAKYQQLQAAQAQAAQIQSTLSTIMAGDLQWSALIGKLQAGAGPGVAITSLAGNLTAADQAAASASPNPLAQPGVTVVGTLSISGTAPDSNSVGTFVNMLSKITGLTDPVPTTVNGQRGAYTFSINVSLTSAALGGRFSPTTAAAASGTPATATATPTPGTTP